ncbi:MAG: hydrogenase iron-sulfur subunit [bacterium]
MVDEGEKLEKKDEFKPKIIGFLCNWCSYAGADLAGTSRIEYEPDIRVIKVPCSGRMDSLFILRALMDGADGVLASGCHPGDCHYSTANYYARRRFTVLRELMKAVGMNIDRFHVSWCSASEGRKWADIVNHVIREVKELGPNRMFENLKSKIE